MSVNINHSPSGNVTLSSPTSGTSTFVFPVNNGATGYVLSTDGSGNTSWISAGGGGGGGGLTWEAIQTGNFNALAGSAYPVNTTSGAITVTLPASPTAGQILQVVDYAGTFSANNCTINRNGNKINGQTSNVILSTDRESVAIVYVDATQGWIAYSGFEQSPIAKYANYLVVAGGGGGGSAVSQTNNGGGGGGGGVRTATISLIPGQTYTVVVGAGGAAQTTGTNSSLTGTVAITSLGGGSGGYATVAGNGGSGGGGAGYSTFTAGSGTSGQGNNGGIGSLYSGPLTTTSQGATSAQTSLLTAQSATIVDNSANSFTITNNNTVTAGNSQIPFSGTYSYLFNGTNQWLNTPTNAVFTFGTGALTIECWIYQTSSSTGAFKVIMQDNVYGGAGGWALYSYNNALNLWKGGAEIIAPSGTISLNTWTHVAWSRSGSSNRIFINGTQVGSTATDSTNFTGTAVRIGSSSTSLYFPGYMSNLRVVKGAALYTGTFTPGAGTGSSGGGGGANAVGVAGTNTAAGAGGAGMLSSITGTSVYYGGGGGGAGYGAATTSGAGGSGGGGAGGVNATGTAGTANTGGGGGGASPSNTGGAGGSGVVILAIPTLSYTGTTTGSPTVTTSGTNTILTFTASGSYTA